MNALRELICVVGIGVTFAGCAYSVKIAQPQANDTLPPGRPVSVVLNFDGANGNTFSAELDGAPVPPSQFTFSPPAPPPPAPFSPTQATASFPLAPGSHTFSAHAVMWQSPIWAYEVDDAQVAFTVAPYSVEVHPLSCLRSQQAGSAEIQARIANVSSSNVAAPYTVSFQGVTVDGQGVPDFSYMASEDLLAGTTLDVPRPDVWTVAAGPGAQIAGTVNVQQANLAIAMPRARACRVP